MNFIKGFFKGLLYVICSPLIVAAFALYTVYCIFLFIWEFFVASFKFLSGDKLSTQFNEDVKLKQAIEAKKKAIMNPEKHEEQKTNEQPQQPIVEPKGDTIINNIYIAPDQLNQMTGMFQKPVNSLPETPKEIDMVNNEGGNENESL